MIKIEELQKLCSDNKIIWSNHIILRIHQRGIERSEIIEAIMNGEIIEQYEKDFPFPSCLVLGKIRINSDIHIVCSITDYGMVLITAYYPDERFSDDNKTRREKE